jgi:hypothetical protein
MHSYGLCNSCIFPVSPKAPRAAVRPQVRCPTVSRPTSRSRLEDVRSGRRPTDLDLLSICPPASTVASAAMTPAAARYGRGGRVRSTRWVGDRHPRNEGGTDELSLAASPQSVEVQLPNGTQPTPHRTSGGGGNNSNNKTAFPHQRHRCARRLLYPHRDCFLASLACYNYFSRCVRDVAGAYVYTCVVRLCACVPTAGCTFTCTSKTTSNLWCSGRQWMPSFQPSTIASHASV